MSIENSHFCVRYTSKTYTGRKIAAAFCPNPESLLGHLLGKSLRNSEFSSRSRPEAAKLTKAKPVALEPTFDVWQSLEGAAGTRVVGKDAIQTWHWGSRHKKTCLPSTLPAASALSALRRFRPSPSPFAPSELNNGLWAAGL